MSTFTASLDLPPVPRSVPAARHVARELDGDNPRGRGMALVATVAERWGVEEHRGDKRVRFELASSRRERSGVVCGGRRSGIGSCDRATVRRETSP